MFNFVYMLLIELLMPFLLHPHYQSVTHIVYDDSNLVFQCTMTLAAHDVEQAMVKLTGKPFSLNSEGDSLYINEVLEEYIERNFHMRIHQSRIELDYLGFDLDKDELTVYLESEIVDWIPVDVTVENSVLMEFYPEQQNIIHFTYDDLDTSKNLTDKHRIFVLRLE